MEEKKPRLTWEEFVERNRDVFEQIARTPCKRMKKISEEN